MKTLNIPVFFLFFTIFSATLHAQNYVNTLNDFIDYNNINITNLSNLHTYDNVDGTPYIYGDFTKGIVKLNNGKYYEGELRFDNYKGKLEFKNEKGEVLVVVSPQTINTVTLNDATLVYKNIDGSGKFFRRLVSGTYALLAEDEVEYNDPEPARPYVEASPASFKAKKPEYFLYSDENGLVELKNKKSLKEVYPEKTKEIQAFVKKEGIRFSDEEDLKRLVSFLNTL
jgi:hypothetical protein